jgi:predicted Fe-Mo cluster-binding NifX family protein
MGILRSLFFRLRIRFMDIQVAVASSDGASVNLHFGKANRFRIYRITDELCEFLEERVTVPACSGQQHDDNLLEQSAELIHDCKAVIAAQIGPGAIDILLYRRIRAFSLTGSIDEAMSTLRASKRFLHLK